MHGARAHFCHIYVILLLLYRAARRFTDIADRAMEEAIQTGSINMYVGTPYAIHIWKDLLDMYYANGESVDFLTRAGGVCASHGTWCDGIVLPPSM